MLQNREFPQKPRSLCFLLATDWELELSNGAKQLHGWGNQGYLSSVRVFSWFIKMGKKKKRLRKKCWFSSASHLPGERASDVFGILSQKAMGASENLSSARVVCIILASGPFPIGHSPDHPTAYPWVSRRDSCGSWERGTNYKMK